jgi:serine/threonine protein kinase/tetratricopeptide (TPR) repeat protein
MGRRTVRRGALSAEERAAAVFGEWRERIDGGETVDPDELIRAHPEIATELRRQFEALRAVARAFEVAGPAAGAAQTAWLAGRTLGRWRLDSLLGSGGMGTVFRAQEVDGEDRPQDSPSPARTMAVKVLHPHLLDRPGFVERFLREAEIGLRVRHANVVATLDVGSTEAGGRPVHYLVMEYVEGRTLRALKDELGILPEALCRHVGREAARALAAIHAAGAVHRDLKPENVIVTSEQVVKVMDLGVARFLDESLRLSQTGAFVGSVQYAAPEQFGLPSAAGAREATPRSPARAEGGGGPAPRSATSEARSAKGGDEVDGRADLHALGVVLYELSTGVHPFHASNFHGVVRRVLDETPRPAAELNPQLSPLFEDLLARLLEKDREKRPAGADDVARILDEGEESAWWRARSVAIREETRRPLRRIRIPRETALYGRDAELARLSSLFQRAAAGDGRVVLLEGEAGIGKSRLVDEFVGQLAQSGEDVNFVFGSYPPGGAATASGAFSKAYREHLGDDEAAVRAALPQTPLLVPAFAALLRGDVAPQGAEALTKDSLHTLFIHATRSLAAARPTIVLIDDLHFAPEEGRALFAALALAVPGHRVLLVGAARPGLDEKWLGQIERLGHATRLALPRLSPKDLVRLLADSLRSTHLAEELAGKIATKSDGNPFFVFEILHGLREGQFLTRKPDGTWATTKLIAEIEVPSSVVDLVQARVSDLSRSDRNVLEVASCIGFEFDPGLVGDVLRIEPIPLLQTLGAIEKSHRLVRSAGRRFVFDHHQIMEVLYAGLSVPLREAYHAAIGAAIEARADAAGRSPAELDGELCVDLTRHFVAGGQERRALRYLEAALDRLERTMRHDALGRLVRRLLAVPGLVGGEARCKLLLRNPNGLGHEVGQAERRAMLEEAVSLADAADSAQLPAFARNVLGLHHQRLSEHAEAEAAFSAAVDLARATGDRVVETIATANLGLVLQRMARHDAAIERFEQARTLGREIGRRDVVATCEGNIGMVMNSLGRPEEARIYFERHLALAREIGDLRYEVAATGNLGNAAYGLGRLGEALARNRQCLELAREIGYRQSEAIALENLGGTLATLGSLEEAEDTLERSVALAREIEFRWLAVVVECGLGHVAVERGDDAAAQARFDAAVREGTAHGQHIAEFALVRCALAGIAERAGRRDDARALFEDTLAAGGANIMARIAAIAGLVRTGSRAPQDVERAFDESRATMSAFDRMAGHFLVWRACGDSAHLVEAKHLLDRFVEHAPEPCRGPMLVRVSAFREIAEAARANHV